MSVLYVLAINGTLDPYKFTSHSVNCVLTNLPLVATDLCMFDAGCLRDACVMFHVMFPKPLITAKFGRSFLEIETTGSVSRQTVYSIFICGVFYFQRRVCYSQSA